MGWFSSVFGGGDAASKAIDIAGSSIKGIGSWIDNSNYTDQEKAATLDNRVAAHLKLVELANKENSIRSVTRRYMAWAIVGFTLVWASIGMVLAIFGAKDRVSAMLEVAAAFQLGNAFVAVAAFYFGVQFFRNK